MVETVNNVRNVENKNQLNGFRWIIPRIINNGASYADVMRVFEKAYDHESWYREWTNLANFYYENAEIENSKNNTETSGEYWLLASNYYRTAQFIIFKDTPLKHELYKKSVECYKKACLNLYPYFEVVQIKVGEQSFPGYLTMPSNSKKMTAVIVLHGTDSTKEETHNICSAFWKRGIATLTFDGPGQAETRLNGITLDKEYYAKVCSAAVDLLQEHPLIEEDSIGVWGQCLGGYLGIVAAAYEPRIKACASLSGFYYLDTWFGDNIPTSFKKLFMYAFDVKTFEELKDKAKNFNLEGIITKVDCPMLIVHSTGDFLVSASEAKKIYDEATCPKELKIYNGSVHCCSDIIPQVRPFMIDWIKSKLISEGEENI
ncbi:alpha/beta hydrolase family protein [Clostridium beijerinckii]|uniref:2,6-dihydropseudooxynicotine hydrolase n=1 Tax=Clostridium beijerinckii TaxID=1520 RepID=A0A1S8SKB3_CLOBE|nr:alpha/beta hydrolase [Clostridium beijerinckii]NRY61556.1 2,6-dihydroxypseudooxynicotine hydrolase [Clostridium beijerinckii]OOM65849.1 2,6-dihydropseudooxynicotine hydrolase [Clostridium beijerinckii]